MNLTEEQKEKLWRKYINPEKDLVNIGGKTLLTPEASKRIAQEFNLGEITPNARFEQKAICDFIVKKELQRLAAADSIARARKLNQEIVGYIREMKELGKDDFQIAQGLVDKFSKLPILVISNAISTAVQEGILLKNNTIKKDFLTIVNRMHVTQRFIVFKEDAKDNDTLREILGNAMFNLYEKNILNLGQIHTALINAGIEDEMIESVLADFYKQYESVFIEQYKGMYLTSAKLADSVYDKYLANDVFDSRVIIEYIKKLNDDKFDIEEINYYLYQKDGDERAVYKILMLRGISVDERVKMLKDLNLQYPATCIKRTFELLEDSYNLPYDEILQKYIALEKQENGEFVIIDSFAFPPDYKQHKMKKEVVELKNIEENVSLLNASGDGFEEVVVPGDAEDAEIVEEPNVSPRPTIFPTTSAKSGENSLKIVKKEKMEELSDLERKKTLATLIVGAGFIPVAVLATVFKVDPLTASKNCVTALGQLINGSMGLKDFLPEASQLTAILAGMGTTFVGSIKYLKSKKQLTQVKAEIESLPEDIYADDLGIVKRGRK